MLTIDDKEKESGKKDEAQQIKWTSQQLQSNNPLLVTGISLLLLAFKITRFDIPGFSPIQTQADIVCHNR